MPTIQLNARAKPLDISRAEDLPEEILNQISYFVPNDSYHDSGGVVNKEGLCSSSLVCQYYFKRLARYAFCPLLGRREETSKSYFVFKGDCATYSSSPCGAK